MKRYVELEMRFYFFFWWKESAWEIGIFVHLDILSLSQ